MMNRRTDLAVEAQELWGESADHVTPLSGVRAWDSTKEGYPISVVEILNDEGAQALGKPVGTYLTITVDSLLRRETDAFARGARLIARELSPMLGEIGDNALVLVVGLGNRAITPDAIGPRVQDCTLVTRHLISQLPEHFGDLRPVCAMSTGVLGTTGVESGELVRAVVEKLQPACVIAVDALASRSVERLCRTIQISNTGIAPGSGVGNHRHALSRETLGVPVIAMGVPTVVDGRTLVADLTGAEELPPLGAEMDLLVTPKDIDSQVLDLSKLMGYAINLALQPSLTVGDLDALIS